MDEQTNTTEQTTTETDPMETALNEAVTESIGGPVEQTEETPSDAVVDNAEMAKVETAPSNQPSAQSSDQPSAPGADTTQISPNPEPTADAGDPVDEVGETIDAMDKDGGYDPNLMKLLKGLVAENRKLKSAGESAAQLSFFDKQFGSLDEGVRSHCDAAHKSQLKAKFDILSKGYKDSNVKISREDVFQEAAKLALGDLMAKAAEERKTSMISQRRNLTLARPGGEAGQRRHNGPVTEADIANEIWDQINQ